MAVTTSNTGFCILINDVLTDFPMFKFDRFLGEQKQNYNTVNSVNVNCMIARSINSTALKVVRHLYQRYLLSSFVVHYFGCL